MNAEEMEVESRLRVDFQEEYIIDNNVKEAGVHNLEGTSGQRGIKPQLGMEFSSQQAAFEFYNQYALKKGFRVRWSSTSKSRRDHTLVINRTFVCSKQGLKRIKNTEEHADTGVSKPATRAGCNAKMKVVLTGSKTWKITKFVELHDNHGITSPRKASKHCSHNKLPRELRVRNLINDLHNEGLPNARIAKVVNVLEPNQDDIVTSHKGYDHLKIEWKNNINQDCVKVIRHFKDKNATDPDFYFNFELSNEGKIHSVFWADGRSRMSYLKFSDVIVFDVTYRTTKFILPFAYFTGINHHRQSSLFGCTLLADETEATFVWLFQQLLQCMWFKAPGTIITDHDVAIGNAIAKVFPNTRHRYCDWHLDKNITDQLLHLRTLYDPDIKAHFDRLRGSDSISEAEGRWNEIMDKYQLPKESWMPKLWEQRENWMPCYLKDTFFASTTCQRVESINSFFDTSMCANTSSKEFVVQYEKVVATHRAAEEDEDVMTMTSMPMLCSQWPAEEFARKFYTRTIFAVFRKEVEDCLNYWSEKVSKEGNVTKYIVGMPGPDRSKWRYVTYEDFDESVVSCECKQFENGGILCGHTLNILWKKRVLQIPNRYILNRWTISARHHRISGSAEVSPEKAWELRYMYNMLLEKAITSVSFYKEFYSCLSAMLVKIDNKERAACLGETNLPIVEPSIQVGSSVSIHRNIEQSSEIIACNPIGPVRTEGQPRAPQRLPNGLEQSQRVKEKKRRTCSFCKEKGHYRTGCKQAKAIAENNLVSQYSNGLVNQSPVHPYT